MLIRFTRFTFLFAALMLGTFSLQAQRDCGTMEALEQAIEQDPTILDRMDQLEAFTRNFHAEAGNKALTTIPVVFHIVYNNNTENISLAQIQSQLDVLNADFRRLNSDSDNAWPGIGADTEIEFCLATVDPSGNATSGIIRQSTSQTSFGTNGDPVKFASSGGSNAWPAADYMNFWVCDLAGGLLGYAQFPGGSASTDGVVCDYAYVGTVGAATAPFDLGRTATHEVGHYLNLRHIWGDGGCGASDFVNDTPDSDASNGGCQIGSVSCGTTDMVQNYMDYSDDACMNLFTNDQKTRMKAALSSSRSSLANSNGCGVGSTPTCTDGIQNGSETGVDCGGSCAPCSSTCSDSEVTLTIVADNYGSETTWTLKNAGGSTIASGGPFSNNSTNTETFCLPDGCYDFTINDSYGDGICCSYGNGSYSLTGSGVSESGGSFTSSETKNFCVGGGAAPTCTDGIQNGDETGVDCGGSCSPCVTPPTCNDGIQNGDETGIDCGGSNCAPCGGGGCTDITFDSENFESGYGNWIDGGSDCVRSKTRPIEGARSVYLRDNTNTSVLTSVAYNMSSLEELTVDFSYYPYSMENGEDFWLQVDNGSGFQTVQTWARGTDFNNNTLYNESVTITASGGFGNSVQVRFRCDASGNSDYVHLDNIVLGGCQQNGSRIILDGNREYTATEADELDDEAMEVDYQVFPNPTSGNFNVRIDEEGYTARLTSVTGQVLLERQLTVGVNKIRTEKLAAGMYLLVIEGRDGFREVEKLIVK